VSGERMRPRSVPEILRELADALEAHAEGAPPRAEPGPANDPPASPRTRRRGTRVAPPAPAVVLSETDLAFGHKLLRRIGR
jgi:hypothetical protein